MRRQGCCYILRSLCEGCPVVALHIHPPPSSIPSSIGPGGSHHIVQMQLAIPGNIGMIAQHQHGRWNRWWYLGIQSKKDPVHMMTEVYKALMALGCEWLQMSSYHIKGRWRPDVPRESLGWGRLHHQSYQLEVQSIQQIRTCLNHIITQQQQHSHTILNHLKESFSHQIHGHYILI